MRWTGHVVRMKHERLVKGQFEGQLNSGKRPEHKQRDKYNKCERNSEVTRYEQKWSGMWCSGSEQVKRCCEDWLQQLIGKEFKSKNGNGKVELKSTDINAEYWICVMSDRIPLSEAGYMNNKSSENWNVQIGKDLRHQATYTACVTSLKDCKTISELKRHVLVHKSIRVESGFKMQQSNIF